MDEDMTVDLQRAGALISAAVIQLMIYLDRHAAVAVAQQLAEDAAKAIADDEGHDEETVH